MFLVYGRIVLVLWQDCGTMWEAGGHVQQTMQRCGVNALLNKQITTVSCTAFCTTRQPRHLSNAYVHDVSFSVHTANTPQVATLCSNFGELIFPCLHAFCPRPPSQRSLGASWCKLISRTSAASFV